MASQIRWVSFETVVTMSTAVISYPRDCQLPSLWNSERIDVRVVEDFLRQALGDCCRRFVDLLDANTFSKYRFSDSKRMCPVFPSSGLLTLAVGLTPDLMWSVVSQVIPLLHRSGPRFCVGRSAV